jgi:hypothetical protein
MRIDKPSREPTELSTGPGPTDEIMRSINEAITPGSRSIAERRTKRVRQEP